MRAALIFCILLAFLPTATAEEKAGQATPASLEKAALLVDGATRIDGSKTCTFEAKATGCLLTVKTSCVRQIGSSKLEYWYTADIPVGSLDPSRTVAKAGAGDHPDTWGVDFATIGVKFPVTTDSGNKSEHSNGTIGFAQGKNAAKRAKYLASLLLIANGKCR